MSEEYDGPERRRQPELAILLTRLEVKLDALADAMTQQLSGISHMVADHEQRVRGLEAAIHTLATKADIEEVEDRRETQMAERQRRTIAWVSVAIGLAVPIWIWIAGIIERQL